MSELTSFLYENENVVRSILQNGNPWFVGKDVCAVLGHKNHNQALSRLDEDERDGVQILDSMKREQEIVVINESGLYSLIFSSRVDAAKKFKKWVTSELLPTIRKTGQYKTNDETSPNETQQDMMMLQNELLRLNHVYQGIKTDRVRTHKNIAKKICEKTKLSDGEIAEIMEEALGDYMPEWIAYQRRQKKDEKPKPDLHLVY